MPKLSLRLQVPLTAGIVFGDWVPLAKKDGIVHQQDGATITIWFPEACFEGEPSVVRPRTRSAANVTAVSAMVEVEMPVTPELGVFITEPDFEDPDVDTFLDASIDVARDAYMHAIHHLNRLLSYIRVERNQTWLAEYRLRPDQMNREFAELGARVSIDGGPEKYWNLAEANEIKQIWPEPKTWVTRGDWRIATQYVAAKRRPNLVRHLLTGAAAALDSDQFRSAVLDASTALEVAMSEFFKSENASRLFKPALLNRVRPSAPSQIQSKLGVRGTIGLLMPFLLPESRVSSELLVSSQDAIDLRNAIAHAGKRTVKELEARKAVDALTQVCEALLPPPDTARARRVKRKRPRGRAPL